MRVKCNRIISPHTKEDLGDDSPWLKIGKEYLVLALSWSSIYGMEVYLQSENYHDPIFFDLIGFEIVSQVIPTNWETTTKQHGKEFIVSMYPKSWMYENFFENISNEEPEAIELFNQEVKQMYREEGLIE